MGWGGDGVVMGWEGGGGLEDRGIGPTGGRRPQHCASGAGCGMYIVIVSNGKMETKSMQNQPVR